MFLNLAAPAIIGVFLLDQGSLPNAQQNLSYIRPAAVQQTETPAVSPSNYDKDARAQITENGNLAEVERQIVEKTNVQRARYGLPPLALDKSLEQTARTHAAWMTNNHSLQHTTQNVGENIAMGQRDTEEAVSAWMASPGHRANILSNSYKRIGVAAYRNNDGTTFWCQQFLP